MEFNKSTFLSFYSINLLKTNQCKNKPQNEKGSTEFMKCPWVILKLFRNFALIQ